MKTWRIFNSLVIIIGFFGPWTEPANYGLNPTGWMLIYISLIFSIFNLVSGFVMNAFLLITIGLISTVVYGLVNLMVGRQLREWERGIKYLLLTLAIMGLLTVLLFENNILIIDINIMITSRRWGYLITALGLSSSILYEFFYHSGIKQHTIHT